MRREDHYRFVDGMPIGVKDLIETVDMPTEYGSELFKNNRPIRDAASVNALREGGAVILGKTVTVTFGGVTHHGPETLTILRGHPAVPLQARLPQSAGAPSQERWERTRGGLLYDPRVSAGPTPLKQLLGL